MVYVLVRHKVEDYGKWKASFDEHRDMRKASGSKGGHIFRYAHDPNELMVLLEWSNIDDLKRFIGSEDLKETMQKAGVIDKPDVYFLEVVDKPSE